jgi:transposase
MVGKRNAYRIWVAKPEGKMPQGRTRRRWMNNVKINVRQIGRVGVVWIDVAHTMDQWRALVNMALNLRVP